MLHNTFIADFGNHHSPNQKTHPTKTQHQPTNGRSTWTDQKTRHLDAELELRTFSSTAGGDWWKFMPLRKVGWVFFTWPFLDPLGTTFFWTLASKMLPVFLGENSLNSLPFPHWWLSQPMKKKYISQIGSFLQVGVTIFNMFETT